MRLLTHRLLVPGVYLLGALLIVIGLIYISLGVPIVRMEIGWTEVVGGSVAASAGCVILAMGVLAGQLEGIRQSLTYAAYQEPSRDEPAPMPASDALLKERVVTEDAPLAPDADVEDEGFPQGEAPRRLAHPLAPQSWPSAGPAIVKAEPPLALVPAEDEAPFVAIEPTHDAAPMLNDGAPALVHAEEETSHSPAVTPPDRVTDPVADLPAQPAPAKSRPNFLSSFLARRSIEPAAAVSIPSERASLDADLAIPAQPPTRTAVDLSSGWDEEPPAESHRDVADLDPREPQDVPAVVDEPEAVAPAEPEPPVAEEEPAPAEPDPLQPVVVGRYNAGAASYVMYSNGMIEVETEQGTHQFGSMQELKNFIEKRDARVI